METLEQFSRGLNQSILLLDTLEKLNFLGYMTATPQGANHICILGKSRKYFKLKQGGARSVVHLLTEAGFSAYTIKAIDGFNDIYVKY